jgi:DNA-binding transcriptional MerR regulator
MSELPKEKKLVSLGTSGFLPEGMKPSEVEDKPKRRQFEAAYKLEILEKIEECRGTRGAVGELLRKEGLYAAQVAKWRDEAEEALSGALKKKRGPKPNLEAKAEKRIAQLEREKAHLQERLRQAEVVIEVQKKISEILGVKQPDFDWKSESE